MDRKDAFSLAEVLITLTIIGAMCLILLPIMTKQSPKGDKIFVRKAYNTVEKVIYDLIRNDSIYPDIDFGFAAQNANVFCTNFIDSLNTIEENTDGVCTATTSDGTQWQITNISFPLDAVSGYPTETYNTTITVVPKKGKTFSVKVRYDGKIKLEDSDVIQILKEPMDIK